MVNKMLRLLFFGIVIIVAVMAAHHAAHSAEADHGKNMPHCMSDMDNHCRMNTAMQRMVEEMEAHRSMQHCMPKMSAHCQVIADLEFMGKRMESMRVAMQHCMEKKQDCPTPEMAGEMKAMRDRMDAMSTSSQPAEMNKKDKN